MDSQYLGRSSDREPPQQKAKAQENDGPFLLDPRFPDVCSRRAGERRLGMAPRLLDIDRLNPALDHDVIWGPDGVITILYHYDPEVMNKLLDTERVFNFEFVVSEPLFLPTEQRSWGDIETGTPRPGDMPRLSEPWTIHDERINTDSREDKQFKICRLGSIVYFGTKAADEWNALCSYQINPSGKWEIIKTGRRFAETFGSYYPFNAILASSYTVKDIINEKLWLASERRSFSVHWH